MELDEPDAHDTSNHESSLLPLLERDVSALQRMGPAVALVAQQCKWLLLDLVSRVAMFS
jgi:hypothetical protein